MRPSAVKLQIVELNKSFSLPPVFRAETAAAENENHQVLSLPVQSSIKFAENSSRNRVNCDGWIRVRYINDSKGSTPRRRSGTEIYEYV